MKWRRPLIGISECVLLTVDGLRPRSPCGHTEVGNIGSGVIDIPSIVPRARFLTIVFFPPVFAVNGNRFFLFGIFVLRRRPVFSLFSMCVLCVLSSSNNPGLLGFLYHENCYCDFNCPYNSIYPQFLPELALGPPISLAGGLYNQVVVYNLS